MDLRWEVVVVVEEWTDELAGNCMFLVSVVFVVLGVEYLCLLCSLRIVCGVRFVFYIFVMHCVWFEMYGDSLEVVQVVVCMMSGVCISCLHILNNLKCRNDAFFRFKFWEKWII